LAALCPKSHWVLPHNLPLNLSLNPSRFLLLISHLISLFIFAAEIKRKTKREITRMAMGRIT